MPNLRSGWNSAVDFIQVPPNEAGRATDFGNICGTEISCLHKETSITDGHKIWMLFLLIQRRLTYVVDNVWFQGRTYLPLSRPLKDVVEKWPSELRHEPVPARYFPADKTHLISHERYCTQGQQTTAKHIEVWSSTLELQIVSHVGLCPCLCLPLLSKLHVGILFREGCFFTKMHIRCIKPRQSPDSTPLESLFHAILARAYATMERPRGSCTSCCYSIASTGCSHSPTSTRDPSKRGTASLRRSNNANQLGLEAIAERDLPEIHWRGVCREHGGFLGVKKNIGKGDQLTFPKTSSNDISSQNWWCYQMPLNVFPFRLETCACHPPPWQQCILQWPDFLRRILVSHPWGSQTTPVSKIMARKTRPAYESQEHCVDQEICGMKSLWKRYSTTMYFVVGHEWLSNNAFNQCLTVLDNAQELWNICITDPVGFNVGASIHILQPPMTPTSCRNCWHQLPFPALMKRWVEAATGLWDENLEVVEWKADEVKERLCEIKWCK